MWTVFSRHRSPLSGNYSTSPVAGSLCMMLADASPVLKAIYNPPASNLGVHLAAVIDSSTIPESNSKRERLAPSAHPCHLRHITMVETCLIPTARCPSLLVHGSQRLPSSGPGESRPLQWLGKNRYISGVNTCCCSASMATSLYRVPLRSTLAAVCLTTCLVCPTSLLFSNPSGDQSHFIPLLATSEISPSYHYFHWKEP